jgi:hypothetical protein
VNADLKDDALRQRNLVLAAFTSVLKFADAIVTPIPPPL